MKIISLLHMTLFGGLSFYQIAKLFYLHWTPPGLSMTDREFALAYTEDFMLLAVFIILTFVAYVVHDANR